MSDTGPDDIGKATTLRVVDLSKIHSVSEPAPEGYEWITTPGSGGMFGLPMPSALLCMRCGVLVGIAQAHDAWHEWLTQANQ